MQPKVNYEAVVIPGLENFAARELNELLPDAIIKATAREGRLSVLYGGEVGRFNRLNSVVAMHAVTQIEAARPSALLGHQNFSAIVRQAEEVMQSYAAGSFETLRVSAAGAESPVLRRFRSELASTLGLEATDAPAHLDLALRRSEGPRGWELLLRLTPKPLSSRSWRVCDYPGALNATVAHVMIKLTRPRAGDVFVNACCGSGTLLAEGVRYGPVEALGFDNSEAALACARANLQAQPRVALVRADAANVPLPDESVSALVTDPPFGMLQGNKESNQTLYAAIFREAARVLKPGGAFALISTQQRLMRELLTAEGANWSGSQSIELKLPFEHGYIRPTVYLLQRTE